MKQTLLNFLILPMVLFTASVTAQSDVWDFGAADLSRLGYTNKLTVDIINTKLYPDTWASPGDAGEGLANFTVDETISYVTRGTDRLRTDNTALIRYDENLSPKPDYAIAPTNYGCVYANGTGHPGTRYMAIQMAANETFTFIVSANSTGGSTQTNLKMADANEVVIQSWDFDIPANPGEDSDSDKAIAFFIQFTAPTAGEYRLYDPTSKIRYYRIYRGAVANPLGTLSVDDIVKNSTSNLRAIGSRVYLSNVKSNTEVNVYNVTGALVKSFEANSDTDFSLSTGLWFATVKSAEGQKSVKLLVQ